MHGGWTMKAHVPEDDTPYTLAALRCDFGADVAVMVAGIMNTTTAVMTYGADAAPSWAQWWRWPPGRVR
jgi:hypothetical protein